MNVLRLRVFDCDVGVFAVSEGKRENFDVSHNHWVVGFGDPVPVGPERFIIYDDAPSDQFLFAPVVWTHGDRLFQVVAILCG